MGIVGFNPFNTELEDLEGHHLSTLKNVAEGWFMEYKREMILQKDIAKQLSGFANQYGGWLIFGIDENENRMAGSFRGIPIEAVEDA